MVAIALHFVGDHLHLCANFLKAAAHETLDGVDGIFGIGNRLALGHLPDQTLPSLRECNYRRGRPAPFLVRDDLGLATFHDRHD